MQRAVDERFAAGTLGEPASREVIRWLHREFYQGASSGMLRVEHERGAYELVPGEFRDQPEHDVAVGRHLPPSSARVPELLAKLLSAGLFVSDTPKGSVRLQFSVTSADELFPRLFSN